MATCNDCVYRPNCISLISYGMGYDDINGIFLTDIDKRCVGFKSNADFVEVVRCKDCKYCLDMGMSGLYCEHPDGRNSIHCRADDFCNDGEKRDGVNNG